MQRFFIIGIDPGFTCTGIILLEKKRSKFTVIDFDYCIEKGSRKLDGSWQRVFSLSNDVYNVLLNLINKHSITNEDIIHISIESIFYNRLNPKSVIIQSRLLQGLEDVLSRNFDDMEYCVEIYEYNPKTIKKTVCDGAATKTDIAVSSSKWAVVSKIFKQRLDKLPTVKREAVYDAMAIGYTHAYVLQSHGRKE